MPIWRKEHELARVIVHYIGLVLVAIAVTAMAGWFADKPVMYQWGRPVGMALPTSFAFILAGIGFFLVSRGEATHDKGRV